MALILAFVSLQPAGGWGGIALIVLAIIPFVLDLDTSGSVFVLRRSRSPGFAAPL